MTAGAQDRTLPVAGDLDGWLTTALERAAGAGEPDWALARRRTAAARAAGLPTPGRFLELWRRTDFGALALAEMDPWRAAPPAGGTDGLPAGIVARLGDGAAAGLVVQRGGEVVLARPDETEAARGVEPEPKMKQLIDNYRKEIESLFP